MKKILSIKNILKIILLVLIIAESARSCSYAYTIEEFSDLIIQLDNKVQGRQSGIEWYINNKQRIENNISDDFSSIIYREYNYRYGLYTAEFITFNNATITTGENSISLNNTVNAKKYVFPTNNQNNPTITNYNNNTSLNIITSYDNVMAIALFDETYTNTNNKLIDQNYLNYFDLLGAEQRDLSLLPWYFANARVGGNYYNNEISFKLYDTSDNFILYLNADNKTQVNSGYLYQLEIPYTSGITNGDNYKVKYNNNIEDFFESENFIISWEREAQNGEITNPSGEVTGTINLDQTNNKIDNIANKIEQQNEVIKSGDQQIINALKEAESGEEQRQTFWENAYNELFSLDSGDVKELKDRVSGELLVLLEDKNDYTQELEILENLQNTQPTDFAISWNNVDYLNQTIIPSGEINFTRIVDDWGLTRVHEVTRIILAGILGILALKELWKLITITLGIGTEVYDDYKDENATIETTTDTMDMNRKMRTITQTQTHKGNKQIIVRRTRL